jgi:FHA domain-containing protein
MIDTEEKMGTTVMMMANGEGMRAAETTGMQGDTMKAMIKAKAALGVGSIMIEATVHKTIATAVSVVTSAEALRGALRPLVAHVRNPNPAPARGLIHRHRLKTKPNLISPRRACSRPRRTRSSTRMERVPCSNTMNRLRLVSLLLGGGFTFSRMMSKSVRSRPPFSFPPPHLLLVCIHSTTRWGFVDLLHIHRQSAYLIGRDRMVTDIPLEHPSCSKQHAVIQCTLFHLLYRLVSSSWSLLQTGSSSRRTN